MNSELLWIIKNMTIEELKKEIDNKNFVDKKLKDFVSGKKAIDSLENIKNMGQDVQYALLLYVIYKIKGGK